MIEGRPFSWSSRHEAIILINFIIACSACYTKYSIHDSMQWSAAPVKVRNSIGLTWVKCKQLLIAHLVQKFILPEDSVGYSIVPKNKREQGKKDFDSTHKPWRGSSNF